MNNLKELRTLNNLTQQNVADYINMTRASYTNIENGKRAFTLETAALFASLYNVSIDCVYGREPIPAEKKLGANRNELKSEIDGLLNQLAPEDVQKMIEYGQFLVASQEKHASVPPSSDQQVP